MNARMLAVLTLAAGVLGKGAAMAENPAPSLQTAVLGGGCFWCLEAVFEELQGVAAVESGYAGGQGPATYQQVCAGGTGHAEVVRIAFDPAVIDYRAILGVFFAIHDPTTLNRQGADVGDQYRSVIFTTDESQAQQARDFIAELKAEGVWDDPVVTEVVPLREYHRAEDYHQDYYRNNPSQGYCRAVINPKLAKFRKEFAARLKD